MKKIIIIAVAVMLLAGIGVGAMLFLKEEPPLAEGEEVVEPVAADPVYFGLDPDFVIAFQQPKTARFLKAAVEVMARDDDVIEDIKLHMPAIRDSVVMLLSTKEETALMSREGKEQLRAEILAEVQAVLEKNTGNPGIEAVYFTNFVMQ
ncbi:MAG: flagellar basal body-associated FliL family protein [Gammaproteobacteria bacterium]